MSARLVIFDCDGVLVDSEKLSAQTMATMATPLGLSFSADQALTFVRGRKVAEWVAELEVLSGHQVPDHFIAEFRSRTEEAFTRELRPVPGVTRVLRGLRLPFCVASSSPLETIRQALEITGLLPFFDGRIYSAYEVGSWKPDPGLFLHAAHDLGVPPSHCAVVEDSVVGVTAGVAAGMTVYGYAPPDSGMAATLQSIGARSFPAMARLPRLIDQWTSQLTAVPVAD